MPFETERTALTAAGWQRLGDHSSFWKAPDDTGPTGRKYTVLYAHAEMLRRQAMEPPARKTRRAPTNPKTVTARAKTPVKKK